MSTRGPPSNGPPTSAPTSSSRPLWYENTTILIGIAVGGVVVLVTIFVVIGCVCCRKKKKRPKQRPQQRQQNMTNMHNIAPNNNNMVQIQGGPQQPHVVANPPGPGGMGGVVVVNPTPQGYVNPVYPGPHAGPRPDQQQRPMAPHPQQRGPRPQQVRPAGPQPRQPPPGQQPRPTGQQPPRQQQPGVRPPGQTSTMPRPQVIQNTPGKPPQQTQTLPSQKSKYPNLERPPSMKADNSYIKFQVPAPVDYEKPAPATADSKIEEMAKLISRSIAKTLEAINIDPQKIKRQDVLGSGQYGVVYKGEYIPTADRKHTALVALKTIAGDASDDKDMTEFMDEVLRMKSFSHPNVMPMLGMTIMDDKPYMVLPFMQFGDLKSYISKVDRTFLVEDLLRICLQVTRGMVYLAQQHIIHGDLAARNCMVGKEGMVKVADFGLSRHLMQSNYYSLSNSDQLRPIRWMAPECIIDQKYSTKSDVWAFGILMYEVMTRGQRPYHDIKSNDEVIKKLREGYRIPCPDFTADEIYEIMQKCWSEDPANRPSFQDLTDMISILIEQAGADYELPLPVSSGPPPEIKSYVIPTVEASG